MAEQLIDGRGSGNRAGVNQNKQQLTFSIAQTETQQATLNGDSYNINTGIIGLTSTTESGVLFFKNDEPPVNGESTFAIDSLVIGIDDQGTQAGACTIFVVKNPTASSFTTDVDINENRNFGSSNTLSSSTLAYKGIEGGTFAGGTDIVLSYQNAGTRGFYPLELILPKGSSIGIKIDTQTTAGTTNVYCAILGRRLNGKNA